MQLDDYIILVTLTVSFTCIPKRHHTRQEALSPAPTRTNHRGKESRCTSEEGQRAGTADHAPQRDKQFSAGASREGLSRITRDKTTRASPARGGYDAAWSLIERAHGGKREPAFAACAGPRPCHHSCHDTNCHVSRRAFVDFRFDRRGCHRHVATAARGDSKSTITSPCTIQDGSASDNERGHFGSRSVAR